MTDRFSAYRNRALGNQVGDAINCHRRSLGMTMAEYGKALGYPTSKVNNIERGKQRVDHVFLAHLRTIFGVDLNELIGVPAKSGIRYTDWDAHSRGARSNSGQKASG